MPRSVCDQPDFSQGGQALVVTAILAKRRLKRGHARLPGAVALKGEARDRRNVADNARCWGDDHPRAGRRTVPEMIRETQVEETLHDRTKLDTVYEPIE